MSATTTFNNAMLDFLRGLSSSFPLIDDFKRAYATVNILSSMNPPIVGTMFKTMCSQYFDRIVARDETFFLDNDFTDDMKSINESVDIVYMLKNVWASLGAEDKQSIWNHLTLLVALVPNVPNV
jgi:hypothetical protein